MRDLLPSGRFAQLSRLSRKALRLYAESGLLRPVFTNAETGYRYYSVSQLEEAHRIARLRELGMPLETIQETLRSWNSPELKSKLEDHRQHLLRQAAQLQVTLAALETLIQTPQQSYPVSCKAVQSQRYLGHRAWCPPDESCAFIEATQRRMLELLEVQRLQPAGAGLAFYHDEREESWDIEVCVPVAEAPFLLPPAFYMAELPAGTVAFTVHEGECGGNHGMQAAFTAVWCWVREHGHETTGGPFEVYLFDEQNTAIPADYRTEVGWVIRRE